METYSIEDCEIVVRTTKAVLIASDSLDTEDCQLWVPQSVVHADSEVWKQGDVGELVIALWFAEKAGLV